MLPSGVQLAVAPGFSLAIDWSQRILLGDGDGTWRQATDQELATICVLPVPERTGKCVQLFELPRHLFDAWWELIQQAAPERLAGFGEYVRKLADLLAYKALPMPEGAVCELRASRPEQAVVDEGEGSLWGGINVGLEAGWLLLGEPPLRLKIEPSEGYCLPTSPLRVATCTLDMIAPDMTLRIRKPSG